MAALREKDRTGKGQYLDVSMMDSLTSLMFMENIEEVIEEGSPLRTGNITRSGPTGLYHAKDGDITMTAASDDQWRRLSVVLDAPHLLEDPRFADFRNRTVHVEEARQELQSLIGEFTRDEIIERMEKGDVPCGRVRSAEEVMSDQHFWQRGSLQPLRHACISEPVPGVASGFPVIFSSGPLPEQAGAPTLGMHNQDIYGDILGLTPEDLLQLQKQGVV